MLNITKAPKPESPVLFDLVITQVQDTLASELSWLNYSFGKSQKLRTEKGKEKYNYPAVHIRDGKYQDVSPDKKLGSYSFFILEDPQQITFYPHSSNNIEAKYSLIFWLDLDSLYPHISERNTEAVKGDILNILTKRLFLTYGRLSVTNIQEQAKNVFREYDIDEVLNQPLMQPYAAFRFEGILLVTEACS